ncbi:MAG: hypothetical protein WDW38_010052 [Sanguina aurantia]
MPPRAASPPAPGSGSPHSAHEIDNLKSPFEALDCAHFQLFHVKAILISGVGFFTDAYDLFVIGVITPMIGFAQYPHLLGKLPPNVDVAVKGTALVGTLIGQVLFGYLGDRGGRKSAYGYTLLIMIAATILSVATSLGSPSSTIGVFCMWRFLLGIGIGGDYPLSAVITSEYASRHMRGRMVAAVFSMQGIGQLTAALVTIIVTVIMRSRIETCVLGEACHPLDVTWRIVVAIGVIPAVATWYLRTRLPETPRFTLHDEVKAANDVSYVMNASPAAAANTNSATGRTASAAAAVTDRSPASPAGGDVGAAAAAAAGGRLFTFHPPWQRPPPPCGPSWPRTGTGWASDISRFSMDAQVLFGTASCWFLLDVSYYSQNLFSPVVLADIGYVHPVKVSADIYPKVFRTAAGNAIVTCMGTVPGYFFTVAFVEIMGRKTIQYMGFAMMTLLLTVWGFLVLYALCFFFANFGPNATTFIIPGECFPTRFRATCHGISAAWGKAGAILGTFGFGALFNTKGTRLTVGMLSIFMAAGFVTTWLVPETKGKTLEELGWFVPETKGKTLEELGTLAMDHASSHADTPCPGMGGKKQCLARACRHMQTSVPL